MLDKPLEMRGKWWLPEAPERQIGGVLTYHPVEGLRLDLTDAFHTRVGPNRFVSMDPGRRIPLLLGLADGKLVTLLDCVDRSTLYFPVHEVSSVWAAIGLLVVCFANAADNA